MKFRYKKYAPGVLRPVIPVEIASNGMSIPCEVLVDSGADVCIFDAQIAEVLGIDVAMGRRQKVGGIVGAPEFYYVHPVKISVGGWQHDIEAGFLPGMSKFGYGIVGQRGFFELFVIKFDLLAEEVEFKNRARVS